MMINWELVWHGVVVDQSVNEVEKKDDRWVKCEGTHILLTIENPQVEYIVT